MSGGGPNKTLDLSVMKQMYGDLVLQIVALQSENGLLRQKVIELGRKVPPDSKKPKKPKDPNDPEGDTRRN